MTANRKLPRSLLSLLFIASNAQSENGVNDWLSKSYGELYGGQYYDDDRLGAYFVASNRGETGVTVIAEALYERYPEYDFAGIGGHFLWPFSESGKAGFIASQAWETFEYAQSGERKNTDYRTNTAGIELEVETERLAFTAQGGKYFSGYDDKYRNYLASDVYFWGPETDWYLRAAVRRVSNDSIYMLEGYRSFHFSGHPITAYLGASTGDLENQEGDSIYGGAYLELFSTPNSTFSLWAEITEQDDETLLTLELNIAFGAVERAPYLTAFGFAVDD